MKLNTIQLFEMIKNKKLKDKCKINWFPKNRDDGVAIQLYLDTRFYDNNCIRYEENCTSWFDRAYWSFDDEFEIIEEEKEIEKLNYVEFMKISHEEDKHKLYINKINELIREVNKIKKEGK